MATVNSLNISGLGIVKYDGSGVFTAVTTTQYTVQIGSTSNGLTSIGPGSAGQVLQSGGAAANPAYSTATYPNIATNAGTFLQADGTNWIASGAKFPAGIGPVGTILRSDGTDWTATTATYPATTTINQLLYSSAASTIGGLATANNGLLVTSNTGVPSVLAGPGTTGQILQANAAAAPSFSTASYPSTATGTGTILRADGTNWTATSATYPATTTINQILYSSAANTVGGITTANNSALVTDGSGVPSLGTSLSNDFTYTSSTSGATRTLTVSNTSNTASSAANILASTAGATAGDATFQATTTTTTWTMGVDNSVTSPTADPFVIAQGTALGTNNVMSVATSGEINYPLQPAFRATLSSDATNVTGTGTAYTVAFNTESFDQNSDYNNSTFTFTAPVTGIYQFNVSIFAYGVVAATSIDVSLTNSAGTGLQELVRCAGVGVRAGTNWVFTGGTLLKLTAADTVKVVLTASGEAGDVIDIQSGVAGTSFSGYLVA